MTWMIPNALAALTLAALASAAQAQNPEDLLRERLAEKLNTKEPAPARKPDITAVNRGAAAKTAKPGAAAAAAAAASAASWGYAGERSPEHWAALAPEFRQCGVGLRQSPIDIRDTLKVDLEKIRFDYKPAPFTVRDDGRTIQVALAKAGGLTVMGRRYELQGFHFHRPSEERINGQQYDMVVHMVHKDAGGRLAYVAVLIERGPDDKPQPAVQSVWASLPLERTDTVTAPAPLDASTLLPADRSYYTYMGSLTTPPCTEGVLWMVLRQPVQLTATQIEVFSRLYPMNARPVQAGAGRLIKESQ